MPMTAALSLHSIHRLVGTPQQAVHWLATAWLPRCDTDGNRGQGSFPGDLPQGLGHGSTQMVSTFGCCHVVCTVHPQSEFVSAQSGDNIAWPHGIAQNRRGAFQHFVPGLVPQAVV